MISTSVGATALEQQRHREDEEQLVAQRAEGDLLDDRQLAVGGEAAHVGRRDRGVVDDDARRLHARPTGGHPDVVDRGRGQLGQRRDVIEQPDQTACHPSSSHLRRLGRASAGQLLMMSRFRTQRW